jgi:hypothetical protein
MILGFILHFLGVYFCIIMGFIFFLIFAPFWCSFFPPFLHVLRAGTSTPPLMELVRAAARAFQKATQDLATDRLNAATLNTDPRVMDCVRLFIAVSV